jgi:hypothetical protein
VPLKLDVTANQELPQYLSTPSTIQQNLIHEICQKLATSSITWKFCHVSGHQDKHTSHNMLDMWGQLNVEMNSLAKA